MMTKYMGGQVVPSGTYWRRSTGEFLSVSAEGGRLTGGPGDWYVRAPLPLVLLLGPVLGLVFFLTLPLSGMLVLVPLLIGKLRTAVTSGRWSPVHLASGAEPGISYLEPHLRRTSEASEWTDETEPSKQGRVVDLAEKMSERDRRDG